MSRLTYPLAYVGVAATVFMLYVGITSAATYLIPKPVAFFETSLQSSITSSADSFTLVSATDKDGNSLASSTYAVVIDEGTASEEMIIADCTATACTNATRGISVVTGTTSVTALKKAHRRGASVKITDGPLLLILTSLLDGSYGFPNPIKYSASIATTSIAASDQNLVNVALLNDTAFSGAAVVQASETVRGVVEGATKSEQGSSTASGGSGPLFLQAKYATSSCSSVTATSTVVVTSASTAKINSNCIDSTSFVSTSTLAASSTRLAATSTRNTSINQNTTVLLNKDIPVFTGGVVSGKALIQDAVFSGATNFFFGVYLNDVQIGPTSTITSQEQTDTADHYDGFFEFNLLATSSTNGYFNSLISLAPETGVDDASPAVAGGNNATSTFSAAMTPGQVNTLKVLGQADISNSIIIEPFIVQVMRGI